MVANNLLASLPAIDFARLAPALRTVQMSLKKIVYKPGEPIDQVFFPGDGFFSVLTVLQNGTMVEVATVGNEGMVGLAAMVDSDSSLSLTMVQAEMKTCYTIPAVDFRNELRRHGALYRLINRYNQALFGFVMQSTACNAVHSVEQRLSRWLLLAHDRIGADEFPLTQEFVAMMLGASRPTVTLVAGTLQKAGLITYQRGHVTIVDRQKLEQASCECYRTSTDLLTDVASEPRALRA